MKKISKKEPEFFLKLIAKENPNNWGELIHKGLGKIIREFIIDNEQNYQCAYTEISINSNKKAPKHCHIRSVIKGIYQQHKTIS